MPRTDAGFSLIELAIAVALFAVLALAAFEALRLVAAGAPQLRERARAYATGERLAARLRAEARGATSIWAGAALAGSAADDCVELDFFSADAAGPAFWAYRAFPNHGSGDALPGDALVRSAGTAPLAVCDARAGGEIVLRGLRGAPRLTAIAPERLAAHGDPFLGAPDSPYVASGVPPVAPVPLGVFDAGGRAIAGGNTTIEVRLATADATRVVDLLPGTFPNGFTEVLHYTCSERCDVGHDTPAPKTLTSCTLSWRGGWSEYVRWNDFVTNPDGTLVAPAGWFIAGTFVFTYSGTRASDGGTDSLVREAAATNWDAARDYAAAPPDKPAPDGSRAGSFAPWDVRAEPAGVWYADFAPYVAAGERATLATEKQRCDAVQQQGAAGGFYANG